MTMNSMNSCLKKHGRDWPLAVHECVNEHNVNPSTSRRKACSPAGERRRPRTQDLFSHWRAGPAGCTRVEQGGTACWVSLSGGAGLRSWRKVSCSAAVLAGKRRHQRQHRQRPRCRADNWQNAACDLAARGNPGKYEVHTL
jgi:hypothetical protein